MARLEVPAHPCMPLHPGTPTPSTHPPQGPRDLTTNVSGSDTLVCNHVNRQLDALLHKVGELQVRPYLAPYLAPYLNPI